MKRTYYICICVVIIQSLLPYIIFITLYYLYYLILLSLLSYYLFYLYYFYYLYYLTTIYVTKIRHFLQITKFIKNI